MVTDRMGSEPILSVKRSISIDTMLNFDPDCDGQGDSDGTCKQTARIEKKHVKVLRMEYDEI